MKFNVVIPCGPSQIEMEGLSELLTSIRLYTPSITNIYIVNDGAQVSVVSEIVNSSSLPCTIIPTPAPGQGFGWCGRLIYGLATAYRRSLDDFPETDVLRMDTDALIVRPFDEQLQIFLDSNPKAGMIGSSGPEPGGGGRWWSARIYRMSKTFSRSERPPYFLINLFGWRAKWRKLLSQALHNDYSFGETVCGGAYLIRCSVLHRIFKLAQLGDRKFWFLEDNLGEDVFSVR
jgi:hypothetical protein